MSPVSWRYVGSLLFLPGRCPMRTGNPGLPALFGMLAAVFPAATLGAVTHQQQQAPSETPRTVANSRLIPEAGSDGPTISLSVLSDPVSLETELRRLAEAGDQMRLTTPGGQAWVGDYSVGTTETVAGHLLVFGGNAEIFGRVAGNVVTLDGDIVVHSGGILDGDALALGGQVHDPGSGISGHATSRGLTGLPPNVVRPVTLPVRAAAVVGVFLTLLVTGFGIVTFARPPLEVVSDTVANSLGRSFVVGLLAEILVIPTFGMLVVGLALTVVGVLLIPFAILAYALIVLAAIAMGLVAVTHSMGETHSRRRMALGVMMSPNSYRYVLTGLTGLVGIWLVWVLFGWVPVAGWIILGAATIATWLLGTVGFGASLLSRGGIRAEFAGRIVPPEALTDEYLWATPQFGVPAADRSEAIKKSKEAERE